MENSNNEEIIPKERMILKFRKFFKDDLSNKNDKFKTVLAGGYGLKLLLKTKWDIESKTSDIDVTVGSKTEDIQSVFEYWNSKLNKFKETDENLKIKTTTFRDAKGVLNYTRYYGFNVSWESEDIIDIVITDMEIKDEIIDKEVSEKTNTTVKKAVEYLKDYLFIIYIANVKGVNNYVYSKRNVLTGVYKDKGQNDFNRVKMLCGLDDVDLEKYKYYCELIAKLSNKIDRFPESLVGPKRPNLSYYLEPLEDIKIQRETTKNDTPLRTHSPMFDYSLKRLSLGEIVKLWGKEANAKIVSNFIYKYTDGNYRKAESDFNYFTLPKELIDELNKTTRKKTYKLYRGLGWRYKDKKIIDFFNKSLGSKEYNIGDTFELKLNKNFSSWTEDPSVAIDFAKANGPLSIVLEIEINKKSILVDASDINPIQKEILVKPGEYTAKVKFLYMNNVPITSIKEWSIDADIGKEWYEDKNDLTLEKTKMLNKYYNSKTIAEYGKIKSLDVIKFLIKSDDSVFGDLLKNKNISVDLLLYAFKIINDKFKIQYVKSSTEELYLGIKLDKNSAIDFLNKNNSRGKNLLKIRESFYMNNDDITVISSKKELEKSKARKNLYGILLKIKNPKVLDLCREEGKGNYLLIPGKFKYKVDSIFYNGIPVKSTNDWYKEVSIGTDMNSSGMTVSEEDIQLFIDNLDLVPKFNNVKFESCENIRGINCIIDKINIIRNRLSEIDPEFNLKKFIFDVLYNALKLKSSSSHGDYANDKGVFTEFFIDNNLTSIIELSKILHNPNPENLDKLKWHIENIRKIINKMPRKVLNKLREPSGVYKFIIRIDQDNFDGFNLNELNNNIDNFIDKIGVYLYNENELKKKNPIAISLNSLSESDSSLESGKDYKKIYDNFDHKSCTTTKINIIRNSISSKVDIKEFLYNALCEYLRSKNGGVVELDNIVKNFVQKIDLGILPSDNEIDWTIDFFTRTDLDDLMGLPINLQFEDYEEYQLIKNLKSKKNVKESLLLLKQKIDSFLDKILYKKYTIEKMTKEDVLVYNYM